jgi:hypothetical protein
MLVAILYHSDKCVHKYTQKTFISTLANKNVPYMTRANYCHKRVSFLSLCPLVTTIDNSLIL